MLDLGADGIRTTTEGPYWSHGGAFFDHDADGFAERTGWVAATDGLLVIDRNGNGFIDDGRELFGSGAMLTEGRAATSGFDAVADLDSNQDGKIDANDALFSQLRIWQDTDEDGFSFPSELHTLAQLGIASINLTSTPGSGIDAQGNTQERVGTFTWADGSTGQIAEYRFDRNTAYTIVSNWVKVPDEIEALPDCPGYGVVPRLWQAMARDTSGTLKSHVQSFLGASTRTARQTAMQNILYSWTGSSNILASRGRDGLDGPKIGVLSSFFGQSFFLSGGPMRAVWSSSAGVPQNYLAPAASVLGSGIGRLVPFSGPWVSGWKGAFATPHESYRQIFELMYSQLMAQTHLKDVWGLVNYAWDEQKQLYLTDYSAVSGRFRSLLAPSQNLMASSTEGADTGMQFLTASNSEDGVQFHTVSGTEQPVEILSTTYPQDTLDELSEFVRTMRAFDGQDRTQSLAFREDFVELDPELGWVIDTGGMTVIDGPHQGQAGWTSNNIDGTVNSEAIRGSLTEGDGTLNGRAGEDVIYGTSRDEVLINEDGDSLLVGGGGKDTIWAGNGRDVLDGGEGPDTLIGQAGDDTYLFRRGSGEDKVIDADPTTDNVDTIWLGSNITPDDVALRRSADNLVLTINGTEDSLTVQDFFREGSTLNRIEQIQFMDGTVWTDSDIIREAFAPTENDDVLYGGIGPDEISGLGGNDTIFGQAGPDVLRGDAGNDRIYGGAGDDVVNGGPGSDSLSGGPGGDTYLFGRDSDTDTIIETDTTPGDIDVVQLAEDVLPADARLERVGSGFTLTILDGGASLTVTDWLENGSPRYGIEVIRFGDGTEWNTEAIQDILVTGTDANDHIQGFSRSDTMTGGAGDDVLRAGAGADTVQGGDGADSLFGEDGTDNLQGGSGSDYLSGGDGADTLLGGDDADRLAGGAANDTLDGGAGPDTLFGGSDNPYLWWDTANGNDTFRFGRGSDQDTVVDHDLTPGNTDTIQLASDVVPGDVTVRRSADDLVLSITGTTDTLTVRNWFWNDSPEYQVELVQFTDATVWDVDDLKLMALQGTPTDDLLVGYSGPDTLAGLSGRDSIYGGAGSDSIDGGADDDRLEGGLGGDTYFFAHGSGSDQIYDLDPTPGNWDVVRFTDVTSTEASTARWGNDLLITYGSDELTVVDYFKTSRAAKIEEIRFSDGVLLNEWTVPTEGRSVVMYGTEGPDSLPGSQSYGNEIYGLDGDDRLTGGPFGDRLDGGGGNDTLKSLGAHDTLLGGSGNDTFEASAGDDTLVGGTGSDNMNGGTGSDSYELSAGAGQDRIVEYDTTAGNRDVVRFLDVNSSDVTALERTPLDHLVIRYGAGDELTMVSWFSSGMYGYFPHAYEVERIEFADGVSWEQDAIKARVIAMGGPNRDDITGYSDGHNRIYAMGGDDRPFGGALADYIDAGDGNDWVRGNAGDDVLLGGAGSDTIEAGDGADTLVGGPDSDILRGGIGGDTYETSRGSGADTINEDDTNPAAVDVLRFTDTASDGLTSMVQSGYNLVVTYGSGDTVTVQNHFATSGGFRRYGIERIEFSDRVTWDDTAITARLGNLGWHGDTLTGTEDPDVLTGTAANETLKGFGDNDVLDAGGGSDTLLGGPGSDVLRGGSGADRLRGEEDADTLIGGPDVDRLEGGPGGDTYEVGLGAGSDRIVEADTTPGVIDTVQFTDVQSTGVTGLERTGSDLALKYGTSDQLTVIDYFSVGAGAVVEQFSFADGITWDEAAVKGLVITQGTSGFDEIRGYDDGPNRIFGYDGGDWLTGGSQADAIDAGAGNDSILAGSGDDTVLGGAGLDRLRGQDGSDTLVGGTQDDDLGGGRGFDTYRLDLGDGVDSITDTSAPGEGNVIVFGAGIDQPSISTHLSGATLTITYGSLGDAVRLLDFDPTGEAGSTVVERLEFADGSWVGLASLVAPSTEGSNVLTGTSFSDVISGLGGDDTISAGRGDDAVNGGSGFDTYRFDPGDGVDTIIDAPAAGAGNAIEFGLGISAADLSLTVDESTLVINVGAGGDALRLEGFDANDPYHTVPVEAFRFADGTELAASELVDLGFTFEGTPAEDTLTGTAARDTLIGHEADDVLSGGAEDDTYRYDPGDGFDTIIDTSTPMEPNMLIFGPGITPEGITLSHDPAEGTLIFNIGSGVRFTGFDAADPYGPHAVEYFQFADGRIFTYGQMIDKGFDLTGTAGDDTLTGTGATDRITGGDGSDTLSGGGGNDRLAGGAGDDTYFFNPGDGVDLIDDVATASEGNTLVFGGDIVLADMERKLTFQGNTLIIKVGENGDEVQLTGFDPQAADFGPRAVQNFQFSDGTIVNYEELVSHTFIVQGGYADDDLTGTNVTERLYGYEGSDRLNGGLGNDTLTGGTQDDELIGGPGSDLYVVHLLDGVDTIIDTSTAAEGNMILFGEGITPDDITTRREGTTLVLSYGSAGDEIRLPGFDYNGVNGSHVVETLEFADGTQVALVNFVDPATEEDDVILGSYFAEAINARGGNDTVTAFEGSDSVYGGTGSDSIDAGAGDDLIIGGPDDDTLVGGEGQDSFVFIPGDGIDEITDTATLGEGNVIIFGEGILQDDLTTHMEGTTLVLEYGPGDAIRLLDFDYNAQSGSHVVETITFADGSSIRLPSLVDPGTEGDDVILGSYFVDMINAKGGNDTVTTFESDDTVNADPGNDVVDTGAGYDRISGGLGNDALTGGPGDDTFFYNVGDGVDTISDWAWTGEGNRIEFGPGITLDDLTLSYADETLIIDVAANGDQLRLSGFYAEDALGDHAIETFAFSDGTTATYADLIAKGFDLVGTDGDDTMLGTSATDRMQGLAGNDVLDAGAGADRMSGGLGDDVYKVDDVNDMVIEQMGEGVDIVQSSVSYALGANVENLTLTDEEALNATGNELDNTIIGNAANNTLDGGAGADRLVGGLGADTYVVDDPGDVVTEQADEGTDTVLSSVSYALADHLENLTLTRDAAVNGTGNALNNTLTGNGADNVLDGGAGADRMIGGLGNDTYVVAGPDDIVIEQPGEGLDTVQASFDYTLGADVENLVLFGAAVVGIGNELDNVLTGNAEANTLQGGAGNDLLSGGRGPDSLQGGSGSDTYTFNPGDGIDSITDTALPGEGNVLVFGAGIVRDDLKLHQDGTTLFIEVGSNGDAVNLLNFDKDNVTGTHVVETVRFADGSEVNLVELLDPGTEGDDVIITGASDDVIRAKGGNDYVSTDGGRDSVDAGPGDDVVLAGADDDVLIGGAGRDRLDGGTGGDAMAGGADDDAYVVDNPGDLVSESAGEGIDTVESSISYALTDHVENLTLTGDAAIYGTGNELDNVLTGNSSANVLDGGSGSDMMAGGLSDDTYVVDNAGDLVSENADEGIDTVQSSISYALTDHVENLILTGNAAINGTGNMLDNVLTGNSAANVLDGGSGSDTMAGGLGDDTYVVDNPGDLVSELADEGIDTVESSINYTLTEHVENLTLTGDAAINGTGNALDNVFIGNSSANVLDGGIGSDTMRGGLSDDVYVVDNAGDLVSENADEGIDTVESSISYALTDHVENLTLTGDAAINGTGNDLDNVLIGNSAANVLDGGGGSDTMTAGLGDDAYVVDNAGDLVSENADEGIDTVESSISYTLTDHVENLILTGDAAINGTGNALDNVIVGNSADNLLDGSGGADRLAAGAGNDVYIVDNPGDVLTEVPDEGVDTVLSSVSHALSANVEHLTLTGDAAINGTGNESDNILAGNTADNVLAGGLGSDLLRGGSGSDTFVFNPGDRVDTIHDTALPNEGNRVEFGPGISLDDLHLSYQGDTLVLRVGTAGDELRLSGFNREDALGPHAVESFGFSNAIAATYEELLSRGIELLGTPDDDLMLGTNVDDRVQGLAGNDTIETGAGDDRLDGGTGADRLVGGAGEDTYVVDDPGDTVTENPDEGTDTVESS
ncbi:MAG: calcium-binding protein, partial [Thermodesulfobacteriota bacterium]